MFETSVKSLSENLGVLDDDRSSFHNVTRSTGGATVGGGQTFCIWFTVTGWNGGKIGCRNLNGGRNGGGPGGPNLDNISKCGLQKVFKIIFRKFGKFSYLIGGGALCASNRGSKCRIWLPKFWFENPKFGLGWSKPGNIQKLNIQ